MALQGISSFQSVSNVLEINSDFCTRFTRDFLWIHYNLLKMNWHLNLLGEFHQSNCNSCRMESWRLELTQLNCSVIIRQCSLCHQVQTIIEFSVQSKLQLKLLIGLPCWVVLLRVPAIGLLLVDLCQIDFKNAETCSFVIGVWLEFSGFQDSLLVQKEIIRNNGSFSWRRQSCWILIFLSSLLSVMGHSQLSGIDAVEWQTNWRTKMAFGYANHFAFMLTWSVM